jgi:uncharacterized phage protein gp47/JayE
MPDKAPIFQVPSFLQNQDAETIHKRMMDALPVDVDKAEGSFPWDFTLPTALEKAELLQFHLVQTLQLMFPAWAWDEWLDLHAKARGINRKPPSPAWGILEITGTPGTQIPAGAQFAVPATGDSPAVEFVAENTAYIGEHGSVTVGVIAAEPGTRGNVPAGTITIMVMPIRGVTAVTNPASMTGGAEEEEDDELRKRINEIDAASEARFVGSDSDYKRWAEEVPGVGTALAMPEWAGPGTVKVIVIDANGQPANESIIAAVYNHIMSPGNRLQRKAPIGATVTVEAPTAKEINYNFILELKEGETEETVLNRFKAQLQVYYVEAKKEGVVRYNRVSSILTNTDGVKDFTGLTINGGTVNIELEEDEYPVTGIIDPRGGSS